MTTWRRPGARPLVLGHRGASAHALENTLAAFEAARAAGADGVELDVRVCGSGELVVFHDDDLRRLAARGNRIDALSLAEVRAVRLSGDQRIPTLPEVFEALGSDLLVNVELKAMPRTRRAVVARALEAIAGAAAEDRVIVSSFDPMAVLAVRLRAPHLATGLLVHTDQPVPFRDAWLAPLVRPTALHPEHVMVTAARVRAWHRRGWAVNPWTVDAPGELERLAQLGVDAIISNDPAAALAALGAPR